MLAYETDNKTFKQNTNTIQAPKIQTSDMNTERMHSVQCKDDELYALHGKWTILSTDWTKNQLKKQIDFNQYIIN